MALAKKTSRVRTLAIERLSSSDQTLVGFASLLHTTTATTTTTHPARRGSWHANILTRVPVSLLPPHSALSCLGLPLFFLWSWQKSPANLNYRATKVPVSRPTHYLSPFQSTRPGLVCSLTSFGASITKYPCQAERKKKHFLFSALTCLDRLGLHLAWYIPFTHRSLPG